MNVIMPGVFNQQETYSSVGAITFVGGDMDREASNTNDLTFVLPTHQADDFAIVTVGSQFTDNATISTNATGWAQRGSTRDNGGQASKQLSAIFYKKLTSSSESNPSFQWSAADYHTGQLTVWRGVDTTTPFDTTETYSRTINEGNSTHPAITTTTDNCALILWDLATHDDIEVIGLPTTPSGLVGLDASDQSIGGPTNVNDWRQSVTCYKENVGSAGTYTPSVWTHTVQSTNVMEHMLYTIALRAQT